MILDTESRRLEIQKKFTPLGFGRGGAKMLESGKYTTGSNKTFPGAHWTKCRKQ